MLAKGAVKSVQRGVFAFTENTEQHITIAPVNLDKAVLIVDIGDESGDTYSSEYLSAVYAYFASSTSITISSANTFPGMASFRASWQVIEFY